MKKLLIGAASVLAIFSVSSANAAKMRCSHQLPPKHHIAKVIDKWAAEVESQSNGGIDVQIFGANSSCNGSTMTFSPFYMGNDTIPMESDGYVRSNNYGAQINFMIPLDGGMIEQCKEIARRHEQKMRLNYEMVRALKCTEIMKAGFTFRPGSRVEVLCHDIIPIVSLNDRSNSNALDSSSSSGSNTEQQTTPTN